jgi:hypothetical protein
LSTTQVPVLSATTPQGSSDSGRFAAQVPVMTVVVEESSHADLEVVADLGQQVVEFNYQGAHVVRDERYYLMRLRSPRQIERAAGEEQFIPDWVSWEEALDEMSYAAGREWVRRARAASQAPPAVG